MSSRQCGAGRTDGRTVWMRGLVAMMLLLAATVASANVIYVRQGATGANDGTSWADAYTDLQSALWSSDLGAGTIKPGVTYGDEVWVAAGTYKPTTDGDRTIAFVIPAGVAVYGGFAGDETAFEQRDWEANVTTLSGDIDGNNALTGNSYHVVSISQYGVVLDGFTITGGNANGTAPYDGGGGVYVVESEPIIANCLITGNSAGTGGGVYGYAEPPYGALTGVVRNADTNALLADVMLLFKDATGQFVDSTMTNSLGAYSVNLRAGTVTIEASKAPDYIAKTTTVAVIGNTTTTAPDIKLSPQPVGTVAGTVKDASTSAGIVGATLLFTTSKGESSTTTGTGGAYSISLPAGAVTILAAKSPEYQSKTVNSTVTKNTTTTVNISLTPEHTGTLKGVVRDAVTHDGVMGVGLAFTDSLGTNLGSTNTTTTGEFEISLVSGDVTGSLTKTGYANANLFATVGHGTTEQLDPIYLASSTSGTCLVSGAVIDAFTGDGLTGATVNLRAGASNYDGPILNTMTSALTPPFTVASYYFSVASGTYTVEVILAGYVTGYATVVADASVTELPNQNVTISPSLSGSEVRIVLTWGEYPWDLDAHLTTAPVNPEYPGGYHVWWDNRGAADAAPYAQLDVDKVDSYGPETITISQLFPGTYTFFAYNYTGDGAGTGELPLRDSGAQVRIFKGSSGEVARFNIPTSGDGRYWEVFTINGSTGAITATNVISLGGSASGAAAQSQGASRNGQPTVGLINCVITNNQATTSGGGMAMENLDLLALGCTVYSNTAGSAGGGLFNGGYSTSSVADCIFWDDTATTGKELRNDTRATLSVADSCVRGGYTGTGNISGDPKFVDAAKGDFHLLEDSPAVDAGGTSEWLVLDKAGVPRDPAVNANPDMGAYEYDWRTSITINLDYGWNLVAIPFEPYETEPAVVFPEASRVLQLDKTTGTTVTDRFGDLVYTYSDATVIKGLTAYFVFCASTEGDAITLGGLKSRSKSLRLSLGWNMVGVKIGNPVNIGRAMTNNPYLRQALSFDTTQRAYAVESSTLAGDGTGYLIFAQRALDLSL